MSRYDYQCDHCQEIWEEDQMMNCRDVPTMLPCIKCGTVGVVKRKILTAATLSYDGCKSPTDRISSGFNDLLTGIKKASARNNTIQTK